MELSFSLQRNWVASVYKSVEGGQPFLSLIVEKLDGSAGWTVEKNQIESKPPVTDFPAPVYWSRDKKYFYYTHQGFQDGCVLHP